MLTGFKQKLAGLTLVPSGGGCFEISFNGELIYSKLETGKFPDEDAIAERLDERLKLKR